MSNALTNSRAELARAKAALEQLKSAKSFVEFEDKWRDLLGYLEKCWNKSALECNHVKNQFIPWQGTFVKLRRKDPLLSYLKQARDSDNHSVQEAIDRVPGGIGGKFVNPRGGYINSLAITGDGSIHYQGDPLTINYFPEKVEVRSVVNFGTTYEPPKYHRGTRLHSQKDPLEIASHGISFYENYLDQIERKFF